MLLNNINTKYIVHPLQWPIIVPKTRIGKYLLVCLKLTIPALPLSSSAHEAYEQVTVG